MGMELERYPGIIEERILPLEGNAEPDLDVDLFRKSDYGTDILRGYAGEVIAVEYDRVCGKIPVVYHRLDAVQHL